MISKSEGRRLNERRLDLIQKKYDGGLTDAEAAELEKVKSRHSEYMATWFSRDHSVLDEASARIAELKAKVALRKLDRPSTNGEVA